MNTKKLVAIIGLLVAVNIAAFMLESNGNWIIANAETGIGKDIFTVDLSLVGANQNHSGDIVTIVTVNNHTQVKVLDVDNLTSTNPNNASLIHQVLGFPNVQVKNGDDYNICVFAAKTTTVVCKGGSNSPAARPEFVDLSLK